MENENRFISLMSDYGFKAVFADETDTLFLRKSLQALIGSPHSIKAIKFLRNEFGGTTRTSRGGLYDLLCQDEKGNSFIVEMQLGYYKNFIPRAQFYIFQRLNTLVKKGEYKFDDLSTIYCIGFLAHGIFPKSKEYYHFGTLKNQKNEEMDGQIVHIIVEIGKFGKKLEEVETDLDKLIYVMKNLEQMIQEADLPDFLSEDWISQALKKLDKSKMTPEQQMFFEMTLARNATIIHARKEEDRQLKEKAETEGMEIGIEKGEKIGEKKLALKAGKKLKAKGVDWQIIAEATGLSIEEIEKL